MVVGAPAPGAAARVERAVCASPAATARGVRKVRQPGRSGARSSGGPESGRRPASGGWNPESKGTKPESTPPSIPASGSGPHTPSVHAAAAHSRVASAGPSTSSIGSVSASSSTVCDALAKRTQPRSMAVARRQYVPGSSTCEGISGIAPRAMRSLHTSV